MTKKFAVAVAITALVAIGAGCSEKPVPPPASNQVMQAYAQAITQGGKTYTHRFKTSVRNVSLIIPENWSEEESTWKPNKSSKDSIRISDFSNETASIEWQNQQELDVHQVLQATKESDRMLLIVHQPSLKAILVKAFIPDPDHAAGYTLVECRISDERQSDTSLWNACKTAIESFKSVGP